MSRYGNKKWIINSDSVLCRHLGGLLMLLLTLAFFVQVTKPNNSHEAVKLYSLQKGLRWLKENVHLRERLEGSKSGKFNSWQNRNAFAAADHSVSRKPYIKNYKDSKQRDVLKNIISLIKEKEDATIQSSAEPANVVFLLDGSGDIGFRELQFYKMFVKEVYNSIKRPPQGIKFGLFECGSLRHYNQHNILSRTIPNSTALDRILDNLVPINGHCELGKSLQMINTNIFKRPTNDSPKAIVVVLAGHSLDNVTSAANKLNQEGVKIVAFGAGNKADMDQLVTLTVSPLYAFKVPAFEYLPSMSSTAVGFLDKVTEPRYVKNIDSSSQKLDYHEERAQAGYQNEYGNMNYPLLGSNYENGMYSNFGPTLGEPTGGYSDSWSFLTQSGTQEPVQSKVFQNSQTTNEDSNGEETFEENKESIGPTLPQDGTHFKDGSVENAQNLSENINSTMQNQGQSSINKKKPEGEGQPGNVNQGNSGAGAIPSAGEVVASKNVAASSGSSGNLAGSPGNPTGSGPLVNNGKVSTGTGSTGTNGGSFQGGAANTVGGAASNSGQQALTGLLQAVQTQLLPIPVIPVQTIPIQPLPSVVIPPLQTHVPANNAGSMTNQQPPGGNMPPIPQNASNEKPKESNPESKVTPSTENSKENKTPAELSEKPNGTLEKPVPGYQLPSKAPGSQVPTKSTERSKSSKKQTTKSAPSSHSTCLPGNENSPTPRPNASCPTLKKPTSVPSAQGARTKKPTPDKKPTSVSTTPNSNHNSMPQIVLCQVICGSDCCSPKVKTSPTQSTPTTKPTTESTNEPKSEYKSKPTEPPDVMAGPPLPLRYPPCLPKNTHHLLACQLQWPARPLSPSDTFPMYMTLPPATASPLQMENEKETKGNLLGGQCQDFHPDCPAFVMSRMCDQETPFKDVFNVREVCMLSCGVCNSLVEQGTNLTFKKREKGRRPEDMGFPEYSKKFLKRHVLEAQNSS